MTESDTANAPAATGGLRPTVNCSLLFTELPVTERPAAAARAGFDAVEFWWPFEEAAPAAAEVDAFVDAIAASGTRLTGLNFFAGQLPGPDRGVLSHPHRAAEFRANLPVVADIAARTGATGFNALYGLRLPGVDPAEQDRVALENLLAAAEAVAPAGGTVLVEPLSGAPDYPLLTAEDGLAVVRRARAAGAANTALLADFFHLAANGDDPAAAVRAHAAEFGHVQIADHPGRGEPGSGSLDLAGLLAETRSRGYTGPVGLEYKPTGASADSFGWLHR
ncbi:hydroxypyruvate isomerase family protein [Nocardiopsis coralliicola]